MKNIFVIFLLFISTVSVAEEDLYLKNQILDSQILQLTKERDSKWDNLKKCEHDTQGFKIAGITTLVATGIGVYGNIELAKKLKGDETKQTSSGSSDQAKAIERQKNMTEEEHLAQDCAVFASKPEALEAAKAAGLC